MKIGILIDRLNFGGVEKIAIEEVKALRDIGIDADLLILNKRAVTGNPFSELLKEVPVIYLDERLPSFLKINFRIPFFYFFSFFHIYYPFIIPFFINKKEYECIISHNTYTTFTALTISKFKDIPYIIFIWDPISYIITKAYKKGIIKQISPILKPLALFLDKIILESAKVVLVSGDLHYKYIKRIVHGKKIFYLPPGHLPREKLINKRGSYVFIATAWKDGKGLEDLIKILADYKGIRLKVAGKWIQKEYYLKILKLIEKYQLKNRVSIIGEVTERKLNDLYAHALVSVIVNNERGFGLTALEAASNGCPFIVPKESGVARYFKNQKEGLYFRYGDTAELTNKILFMVNNERVAKRMGVEGWKKVKENYSWEKHAQFIKKLVIKYVK